MKIYKYHFSEKESDITIISESKTAIVKAKESLHHNRLILEKYIKKMINSSPLFHRLKSKLSLRSSI